MISKATSQLDQVRKYSSSIDLAELEFKDCFAKTSIKWHFVVELLINFEVDKSLQSKGGKGLFSKFAKVSNNDLSKSNGLDGVKKWPIMALKILVSGKKL